MQARLSELSEISGANFEGDGECIIHAVNTLSNASEGDIAFFSNPKYRTELQATKASAVILKPAFVKDCPVKNRIITDNPYLCFALIAQHIYEDDQTPAPGIHPAAVIDESATISDSAFIGATAVIGKNARIADNAVIGAGTVIGDNCVIGRDCILKANVSLYPGTRLGKRCLIHSGAVLGADGFGFAQDKGRWIKIPQTGKVILGNDVEVGANTTIDCGAINDTVIADGVKLDNLIQVAHNVSLGKNTAIAGMTAIAGSTSIGQQCTIGGCSGIVGHLDIADNVHISAMTIVTKSIHEPGKYTGNFPAMPHNLWAKNMVQLKKLDELSQRVKLLEEKLQEQD